MRKRFWARLLVLVMLFAAFPFAAPAQAANAPALALSLLSFQAQAAAGSTVTFSVQVAGDATVGICCGSLTLKGPKDQTLSVDLFRSGPLSLQGTLKLSPNVQPGTWTVGSLSLTDNGETVKRYSADASFKYSLTVTGNAGQQVDTTAPELVSLTVPDEVTMGDAVTITANVKDNLSGVARVVAYVAPADDKPMWEDSFELFPTGKPGEYAGNMVMDALTMSSQKQQVVELYLRDAAGNSVALEGSDLAKNKENKVETKAKLRKVPEALVTSPYISLIHPGELAFSTWWLTDYAYAMDLLAKTKTDPTTVRETVAAQIPQLKEAINAVRKEVYVDPTTKLRVAPMATTGKWLVLDRALSARMELLVELDRRDGKTRSQRKELTPELMTSLYSVLGQDEKWIPLENTFNDIYGQLPAAYLAVLSKSETAVSVLKAAANESYQYGPLDSLDRDTMYFMPVYSTDTAPLVWGSNSLRIYPGFNGLTSSMNDLFYAIGEHFGQAYLSAIDDQSFVSKWGPYLRVRGNQTTTGKEGWLGSPMNNIGDDFAYSFLPMGLGAQYYSRQSYPRLRENPAMLDGFKKLVADAVSKPSATATVSPGDWVTVGLDQQFQVTVTQPGANSALEAEGVRWALGGPMHQSVVPAKDATGYTFKSNVTELGKVSSFFLTGKDVGGRTIERELRYYRAPVLVDALPGATNKSNVTVTGTTVANGKVDVAGKTVTANGQGRFTADVTLTKGVNTIRVVPTGQSLGALVKTTYEPEAPLSLKVTAPGTSRDPDVAFTAQTAPFSIITFNGMRVQSDSKGNATFIASLKDGSNKVQVSALSPSGNKGSWSGIIVVDSTPPELTVSVPLQTNLPFYTVTGKVERGATLTLDDTEIKPQADGSFSTELALSDGKTQTLHFTATDPAGNQTNTTAEITYVKGVPTVSRTGYATLSGKVKPGTLLTLEGSVVEVKEDGSFSVRVPAPTGRNVYNINATSGGKAIGFLQFVVINPLVLNEPKVDGSVVKVSGKTVPGYTVLVDGEQAAVKATGEWSITIDPKGRKSIPVTVDGDGQTFTDSVVLP